MRNLLRWLTSYPMAVIERHYFTDIVSGQTVGKYRDRHGVVWMATGPFSLFRVRLSSIRRTGDHHE